MINPYLERFKKGEFGSLIKIIDKSTLRIKKCTETEKIRAFSCFISENLNEEITSEELIKKFCLIERAMGSEINGKYFIWTDSLKRYQSLSSFSHYNIILIHALRRLGIVYKPTLIIDRNLFNKINQVIWH